MQALKFSQLQLDACRVTDGVVEPNKQVAQLSCQHWLSNLYQRKVAIVKLRNYAWPTLSARNVATDIACTATVLGFTTAFPHCELSSLLLFYDS
jgi:hypothetical protein